MINVTHNTSKLVVITVSNITEEQKTILKTYGVPVTNVIQKVGFEKSSNGSKNLIVNRGFRIDNITINSKEARFGFDSDLNKFVVLDFI